MSHQALGGTEGTGAGVTHAPWVSLKHSVLMKAFPLVAPGAGQEQRWATFSPPAPSRGSCPASSAARSPAAAGVTPGAGLAAPGGSAGSRSQTCPHREVLGGRGGGEAAKHHDLPPRRSQGTGARARLHVARCSGAAGRDSPPRGPPPPLRRVPSRPVRRAQGRAAARPAPPRPSPVASERRDGEKARLIPGTEPCHAASSNLPARSAESGDPGNGRAGSGGAPGRRRAAGRGAGRRTGAGSAHPLPPLPLPGPGAALAPPPRRPAGPAESRRAGAAGEGAAGAAPGPPFPRPRSSPARSAPLARRWRGGERWGTAPRPPFPGWASGPTTGTRSACGATRRLPAGPRLSPKRWGSPPPSGTGTGDGAPRGCGMWSRGMDPRPPP